MPGLLAIQVVACLMPLLDAVPRHIIPALIETSLVFFGDGVCQEVQLLLSFNERSKGEQAQFRELLRQEGESLHEMVADLVEHIAALEDLDHIRRSCGRVNREEFSCGPEHLVIPSDKGAQIAKRCFPCRYPWAGALCCQQAIGQVDVPGGHQDEYDGCNSLDSGGPGGCDCCRCGRGARAGRMFQSQRHRL